MSGILQAGLQGMLHSQQQLQRSATEIAGLAMASATQTTSAVQAAPAIQNLSAAQADTPPQSVLPTLEPLLRMQQELQVFDASARMVSTADQQIGHLLNIKA